jgi:hypothetical protein
MRDDRVRQLVTADVIAWQHRRLPLFIFKSDNARAIYVFGRRVKQTGWLVDHPEPFRSSYKRYKDRVEYILREPTSYELYGMLPAFHPLEHSGGIPLTVGEYRDFALKAWRAKQVTDVIRLLNQAEAQYIKEDL